MCKRWGNKTYLLLSAAFIAAYFFCPTISHAQTYRVYKPVAQETPSPTYNFPSFLNSVSLSAWGSASLGQLTDATSEVVSDYMVGYRLTGMYEVFDNIYLGIEWADYKVKDNQAVLLKEFAQTEIGGVLEWIFTPQTEPQMYMIFSLGKLTSKADFYFGLPTQHHSSAYVSLGTGIRYRLGKWLKLGGEYRMTYMFSPMENFLIKESEPFRHEVSVGLLLEY